MGNSILYGNGFNYLIKDYPSWSDLIKVGSSPVDRKNLPYTLQFELKVMPSGAIDVLSVESKEKKKIQAELKAKVDEIIRKDTELDLYKGILSLDAENYLTTNYDNILKNYLVSIGYKISSKDRSEDNYSIRRYYKMFKSETETTTLWNIHGDVEKYSSMLLGYNHYCGALWKMNGYLKGQYQYRNKKSEKLSVQPIIQRIKDGYKYDSEEKPKSWLDLFFNTNVHIIGLGLSFDEIDLWWLLNYRKRMILTPGVGAAVTNQIIYYGWDVDEYKKSALESFGVKVVEVPTANIQRGKDNEILNAKELYEWLLGKMNIYFCK